MENRITSFEEIKIEISQRKARLMAARLIIQPDFPNVNKMPRGYPLNYTSLGHFFMFDYPLYRKIILDTKEEIIRVNTKPRRSVKYQLWLLLLLSLVCFLIGCTDPYDLALSFCIAVFLLVMVVVVRQNQINKLQERTTALRVQVVKDLISGTWHQKSNAPESLVKPAIGLGDFVHSTPIVPFYKDNQPFPGFGRNELNNFFTCPLKESKLGIEDVPKFELKVSKRLIQRLPCNSGFGNIISVRASSIKTNSVWLNTDCTPHLISDHLLKELISTESGKSSYRQFNVISVVLPEYDSVVTLFYRLFSNSGAVCFQIYLNTLGPCSVDEDYLRQVITAHEYKLARRKSDTYKTHDDLFPSDYGVSIDAFIERSQGSIKSRIVWADLTIFSEPKKLIENTDSAFDSSESIYWPGASQYFRNVNEDYSYNVTKDFFGQTECLAEIKVIYDITVRQILDELEDNGYDVSDYKKKDGSYSIKADRIDKIIVGETINISEAKKDTTTGTNQQ